MNKFESQAAGNNAPVTRKVWRAPKFAELIAITNTSKVWNNVDTVSSHTKGPTS